MDFGIDWHHLAQALLFISHPDVWHFYTTRRKKNIKIFFFSEANCKWRALAFLNKQWTHSCNSELAMIHKSLLWRLRGSCFYPSHYRIAASPRAITATSGREAAKLCLFAKLRFLPTSCSYGFHCWMDTSIKRNTVTSLD